MEFTIWLLVSSIQDIVKALVKNLVARSSYDILLLLSDHTIHDITMRNIMVQCNWHRVAYFLPHQSPIFTFMRGVEADLREVSVDMKRRRH
jgi:hypothetical protein